MGEITGVLEDRLVSLDTVDPTADRSDLTPVVDALDDATIIGLGEATHGTREFFRFKARLIRTLVSEAECRLVAFESNFAETLALDKYITEGKGDPIDALEGIYFWTWNTDEVLELIEWLREFNNGRPRDDQVRFYGLDIQYAVGPARALDEYLATVDSEFHAKHEEILDVIEEQQLTWDGDSEESIGAADEFVDELQSRLSERKASYTEATSESEYELMVRQSRTLEQALEVKRFQHNGDIEAGIQFRDRAMAENASWILDYESSHTLIVWGHNGHIRRGTITRDEIDSVRTMGDHLAEEHGDRYVPIGFDFAGGCFQAMVEQEEGYELSECRLGSPREGSITDVLANVDDPFYYLDWRDCRSHPAVKEVVTEPREMRTVGAIYHGPDADEHYETVAVGEVYDALVFVDETTRAVPTERS